jgi:hypothetical protein
MPSIDGIVVDKWYGDIFESYKNWYISGWIKSAEGIFIPVVKYEDITIVDDEGNKSTITIAKEEVKSYLQLLKEVYGEELSMIKDPDTPPLQCLPRLPNYKEYEF